MALAPRVALELMPSLARTLQAALEPELPLQAVREPVLLLALPRQAEPEPVLLPVLPRQVVTKLVASLARTPQAALKPELPLQAVPEPVPPLALAQRLQAVPALAPLPPLVVSAPGPMPARLRKWEQPQAHSSCTRSDRPGTCTGAKDVRSATAFRPAR